MRQFLWILLSLLLVVPVAAQVSNNDDIPLVPFTSTPLDVQGVRPETWLAQQNTEGVFLRASDPLDATAIIMQAQETDKETFVTDLPNLLQLSTELELIESLETDFFTWDLYQSTRVRGDQELIIDIGIAEDQETGRVYYILLQTNPTFYDNLHEKVFLPAVEVLSPLQFYVDEEETFSVPIPVLWTSDTVAEAYGQITNPDGTIAIFIDAVASDDAIAASREFLSTVNNDFADTLDEEPYRIDVIEDPTRIGDLEAVYIINWVDPNLEDGFVLQTVARQYDGIIYMTAIVARIDAILDNEAEIATIDNGFTITALEAIAEATAEPEE
ncbi:MAG: hypothetical protein WBC91_17395 [Phototrophicaceae bacterium]